MDKIKRCFSIRKVQIAFICLLPVVTFLLVGPIELYVMNQEDFWFSFSDIIIPILFVSSAVYGILYLIMIFAPAHLQLIFMKLLFGIGLALYIQGNFMNPNYGTLNGTQVMWEQYTRWGIINLAIWFICMFVAFFLKKKSNGNFITIAICICLVLVQIFSTVVILVANPVTKRESIYLSNQNLLTLSQDENLILFILDNFDGGLSDEIFKEFPEYKDLFKDFTYYRNTTGIHPSTCGGLTHLLTGQTADNSQPFFDFVDEAYKRADIYSDLKNNEYEINLYTTPDYVAPNSSLQVKNMVFKKPSVVSYYKLAELYYKFTSFRYAPHFLKKYFWIYTDDFKTLKKSADESIAPYSEDNISFHNEISGKQFELSPKKQFKVYHIVGPHPPYDMDENIERVEDGTETAQARGTLNIVLEFLAQMKKQGIYDGADVFILSDHGRRQFSQHTLLMVKQKGKNQEFKSSSAPVSYDDLMPTLLSIINRTGYEGTIFSIPEDAERKRRYCYYNWAKGWDDDFLPPIMQYSILGEAEDIDSMYFDNIVYTKDGRKTNSRDYQLGTKLYMNTGQTGYDFFEYGLYPDNGSYKWMGKEARAYLKISDYDGGDLKLVLDFDIFAGKKGRQRMELMINGEFAGQMTFFKKDHLAECFISAGMIPQDGILRVSMKFPDAVSPKEIGQSGDSRVLSLALKSMVVQKSAD